MKPGPDDIRDEQRFRERENLDRYPMQGVYDAPRPSFSGRLYNPDRVPDETEGPSPHKPWEGE